MRQTKSGYYTLYKGKEFRLAKVKNGDIFLISENDEDLLKGFVVLNNPYDNRKLLEKKITPAEVGEVFKVYTIAIYHGLPVGIESYHDNKILLATSDPVFLKEHGFKEVDRMVYMKEVNRDEVELVDKRELIPNFFDS